MMSITSRLSANSSMLYSRPAKSKTSPMVGMKGKNKQKSRYQELNYDSEDEMLGRSPGSFSSTFFDDMISTTPGYGMREHKAPPPAIKARNESQKQYMACLEDDTRSIIFAVGPAGTGKTILGCHLGLQALQAGKIAKLILTRPAVSVEEQHGFLPGTLEEKMEPWLRPVYDVFYQYFSPQKLQKLIEHQVIEICPLAYMRGRTFENAWIIADEAQNMTPNQMLMLLTRIGNKSKMIITGDPRQHDRGFEKNGLTDFLVRLEAGAQHMGPMEEIKIVEFTAQDVERHPVIRKILKLYD